MKIPSLVLLIALPLGAQSIPWLDVRYDSEQQEMVMDWMTEPGRNYTFWHSEDLVRWQALDRFIPAGPSGSAGVRHPVDPVETTGFFRVSRNSNAAPELPPTLLDYLTELPSHFLTNSFPVQYRVQNAAIDNANTPPENPTTNAGATLGRVLFYDKKLSSNQTVSCASCHQQEHGFTDPRIQSVGFEGGLTRRHSMSLGNAVFYKPRKFFWDERAATLEEQVLQPIQDPVTLLTDERFGNPFSENGPLLGESGPPENAAYPRICGSFRQSGDGHEEGFP